MDDLSGIDMGLPEAIDAAHKQSSGGCWLCMVHSLHVGIGLDNDSDTSRAQQG